MNRQIEKVLADMYCGGGGASQGLHEACEELGIKYKLYAFNHDPIAIETHRRNHRGATHYCTDLNSVNPRQVIPGGRLDGLLAGPECTFHSNAAGGTPINEQSRASAWRVVEWASQIDIDEIMIENVPEFQKWGPTKKKRTEKMMTFALPLKPFDQWFEKMRRKGGTQREWRKIYKSLAKFEQKKGKVKLLASLTVLVPIKEREGEIYIAFLKALESLGYKVETKILKAANYGDATTRERLFIRATKKRRRIVWPESTHVPAKIIKSNGHSNETLFSLSNDLQPYKPARDIIDWSILGESIFTRKKPLATNTLARIWKGLEKFSGLPFIVPQLSGGANRGVDQPLPTITTTSRGIGLCRPFIVELRGGQDARSVDDPLTTITTKGMHHGLCQPFLIRYNGNHEGRNDGNCRIHNLNEPLPTLDTSNRFGLVRPFLINAGGPEVAPRSVDEPMNTILTRDHMALVRPYIIPLNHGAGDLRSHSIDEPFPTITTFDAWGLIEPFLVKYNGTGGAQSVEEPLDTVTTRDRFGLVSGELKQEGTVYLLDILFRMLEPHELAAAHSFPEPKKYFSFGNREQKVRMIGNAWPVKMGKALCKSMLASR